VIACHYTDRISILRLVATVEIESRTFLILGKYTNCLTGREVLRVDQMKYTNFLYTAHFASFVFFKEGFRCASLKMAFVVLMITYSFSVIDPGLCLHSELKELIF